MGLLPEGSRSQGRLELLGSDPRRLRRAALNRLRGEAVGLVFQDPMTRLNPLISIGDHLRDTLSAHGAQAARAEELLQRVGIGPERMASYPHQFSGGMRQRVAIALAMALQPPLVIADEPTTSLDVAVAGQVMAELTALCQEAGSALLLITHDLAMAGRWCQRMAVMQDGRLLEEASASQVLLQPQQPLTQRLVAAARQREGGATPQALPHRWCWSCINCAVGIAWVVGPGSRSGCVQLMGSACACMPGKPWASLVHPGAARAPCAAP